MITPSYSLTATERILPRLAIDFTTATADARVATTRAANTATRINSSGIIEIVNADLPRFDYDPTTLVCRGQLIEAAATNILVNSLIDGTNLSTQVILLAASAYTLSFYGSGSVTLSGGHSATVSGLGDYPNRKTYTFTPTAGNTTFTVSGDVKFAQLEGGSVATSFIPTGVIGVARNADFVSVTGSNFSSWYNASQGTFEIELEAPPQASSVVFAASRSALGLSFNDSIVYDVSTGSVRGIVRDGGTVSCVLGVGSQPTAGSVMSATIAYKKDDFAGALNGGSAATDTSGNLPSNSPDQLVIGNFYNLLPINSRFRKIRFWPQRITNAEVRAFSK